MKTPNKIEHTLIRILKFQNIWNIEKKKKIKSQKKQTELLRFKHKRKNENTDWDEKEHRANSHPNTLIKEII